jgi:hypothetical protein
MRPLHRHLERVVAQTKVAQMTIRVSGGAPDGPTIKVRVGNWTLVGQGLGDLPVSDDDPAQQAQPQVKRADAS